MCSSDLKKVFLGIWAITLFLPYAYSFFSNYLFGTCAWNSFGTFYYFAGFNGYLLLGYYLSKDVKAWSWLKTLITAIPLFIIGYAATYIGFKSATSNPACSDEELELFFLYCSPNVVLMTIAVFLIVRQIKFSSPILVSAFASIAKCGLGIYVIHYFIVGLGYAIANAIAIPISIRIPITALIVFVICWAIVALSFKMIPKASKWIFG